MRRQLDAMHISGTWQVCTEERLINENNKKYDRQNNTILPAMSGGYGYAVLFLFYVLFSALCQTDVYVGRGFRNCEGQSMDSPAS